MTMWNDLGEFIVNQCVEQTPINKQIKIEKNQNKISNSSCKIVEIAIGKFFQVSDYLSNFDSIELISTDINPGREDVIFDDITSPNMDIYENAKIIYSIRPPQELQLFIEDIIKNVGAKLIVKPLFNEDLTFNCKMNLKNYKKASFYQKEFS
ncbi:hypothetical protein ALNOE001_19140 [Candidatus Methanobinarius endosymbioticus]|uniref:UPF0146 protein ALNOE001_19140 n=1 Tax=Candidatus Methanobinarius endosymbioticus TaxID=2006182 RepID=A0A366M8C6_9EURY|nr:hypothetical protein ALNOE001_19140 [Candidatus Methanobinarius endosymbioticus]